MPTPIFISYAHKDEEWKDRVVTHLRVLELEGMLDVWDDRRIEAGDDWRAEIETAINAANIAVLLISANFLTSKFILDTEVPRLLERRAKQGVRVIPLIVKPCAWTQVKWLLPIQARPKDGRPLSAGNQNQIDTDLAGLANEIAAIVRRAPHDVRAQYASLPPDKISLAKLSSTAPTLFGREEELKQLDDAWNNPHINVVSLVAWGGVGKSALVNKWVAQMPADNYRSVERVFGWSFYSQGAAEGRQVSADQFIATALAWFGDHDPNLGSPWDKGERLAELVKQSRALIILDGLEPLQNPPPVETGRIKDPALVAFLRELARQNPGLVVITTRLAVDDLKDCVGDTVIERDLDNLSPEAGAAYLSHLGVDGTDAERQDAATDFGGHALALTLLGSYLKRVYHGDIRKHHEIPHLTDDQKQGAHARRVLESYERWLRDQPELDILRLMGLFDRPAESGALDALRKKPAIRGLTDALQKLKDADWKFTVANLRDLRLIDAPDVNALTRDTLDCHPLLREHFAEQLKQVFPSAWREGNNRLYEYYKSAAKEFPETIQEMTPLYAAVLHACQAGKHQEALNEVYWRRIQRGDKYFNLRLGAFGAELTVLSGFFDPPWRRPVDGLNENAKSFVLNEAGFRLRALGRLIEGLQPIQAGLEADIARKDWKNSAVSANNLSELYLSIGDVTQALVYAIQSVELADRSGDAFQQMSKRTTLADVLHQRGSLAEAEAAFREAEEMQKKNQPEFPLLYSQQGFIYCDLLLSRGNYAEVQRRASQTLEWHVQYGRNLLDIALDNLSLGSAHLLQSQREPNHPFTESANYLNRAVDGLRQAGQQIYLVLGLLARAKFYRVIRALDKAKRDLDEAFLIGTRGGMRLYLADCHLEYAWWWLAYADKENARRHLAIAKQMVEETGYHRRDGQLAELEEKI